MFHPSSTIRHALEEGFHSGRVLIVGDLMLDQYLWGSVQRISPEAPVPIITASRESASPGGAANVAMNAAGLLLHVSIVGYIGNDSCGTELLKLLGKSNIDVSGVIRLHDRPTISKTRIIGNQQQIARIDREQTGEILASDEEALINEFFKQLSKNPDIIILSDYNKGLLNKNVCQSIITAAKQRNITVLVDPKGNDFSKYKGATAISPNRSEMVKATGCNPNDIDQLLNASRSFLTQLDLDFVMLTRSEHGIFAG